MKDDKLLQHIMEIKEDVAGIRQHLKDMNGRIGKHDTQLTVVCPETHKKVDERINDLKLFNAKLIGALAVLNVFAVWIINKYLT